MSCSRRLHQMFITALSPHGKTYLFAGDTIFPSRGTWQAVVFEDGNKSDLKESLAMLRSMDPDVVLCGAAVADVPFKAMSRAEWHAALEQAARSLREDPIENQPAPGAGRVTEVLVASPDLVSFAAPYIRNSEWRSACVSARRAMSFARPPSHRLAGHTRGILSAHDGEYVMKEKDDTRGLPNSARIGFGRRLRSYRQSPSVRGDDVGALMTMVMGTPPELAQRAREFLKPSPE